MKRCLSLLVLFAAAPVMAQVTVERFEEVTEASQDQMLTMMLGGDTSGVDMEMLTTWDDEMRDAAGCALDAYRENGVDDDQLSTMLDRMEALTDQDFETLEAYGEAMAGAAEGIPSDAASAVDEACGLSEIYMRRMQASGFMDAMMQRAVQE